ncbi:AAA family ATPase [Neptunomonas japonica]|uniref:AAA family ATPase n=1 Tax=Neptunomonas japonica TaxID=417574 RepID=UPI0003FF4247|nr:AAA family ATPase [Neptunomonas japonica]
MRKVLLFGNSGSGKSTLAKELCERGLAHLDLDSLAWLPTMPPLRKPLIDSQKEISKFIESNTGWVIEGCYSDLIEVAISESNEIIFMNLPVDACIANAKSRPWEPHKYANKQAQDANLGMLLDWIVLYPERTDTFSMAAHNELYEKYQGKKCMFTSNERSTYG